MNLNPVFPVFNGGGGSRTLISGIRRAYRFLTLLYYYNRKNTLEFGSYHHHIIIDLGGHHLISAHFYQLSIVHNWRFTEFGALFIHIFRHKAPSESLLFSTIKLRPYIKIEQESILLIITQLYLSLCSQIFPQSHLKKNHRFVASPQNHQKYYNQIVKESLYL